MNTNTTMQDIKEYIEYLKLERNVTNATISFDGDKYSIFLGDGEPPASAERSFYEMLP